MGPFGDFLIRVMQSVGFAICHQLPARSLHYGGRALPVCARDAGIFLGFTACLIVLLAANHGKTPRYPTWPKVAILIAFVLPTYIDAVASYAGIWGSNNTIRLATGALAGTGLAAILYPFSAGAVAWAAGRQREDSGRMLASPWSLPALLLIPAAITLAMWPRWPGAYWFWAPLVTLAILFTFFALNFTLVSLVLQWIRGVEKVPRVVWLVGLGLAAALVELAASNRLHWLANRLL